MADPDTLYPPLTNIVADAGITPAAPARTLGEVLYGAPKGTEMTATATGEAIGLVPAEPAAPAVAKPAEAKSQNPKTRTLNDIADDFYEPTFELDGFGKVDFYRGPPSSETGYTPTLEAPRGYEFSDPAELSQAKTEMIKIGIGLGLAEAAFTRYADVATGKRAIATTQADTIKTLRSEYGSDYEKKITAAIALLDQMPTVRQNIEKAGLANDAAFIRLMVRAAEKRRK